MKNGNVARIPASASAPAPAPAPAPSVGVAGQGIVGVAIELIINGSQILDIGWGWKTDSRWSIGRNQAVDTDADGWSYAADWQSCWYCSQNDVI